MSEPIAPGVGVTLHLRLRLADSFVAESTFEDEPLRFVVGDGTLSAGLEAGLYGHCVGPAVEVCLAAGTGFGDRDESLLHDLPRAEFKDLDMLQPGLILSFHDPEGHSLPGRVVVCDAETVTIDFNHPMAGREIVMEFEVLEVRPGEGNISEGNQDGSAAG